MALLCSAGENIKAGIIRLENLSLSSDSIKYVNRRVGDEPGINVIET